MYIVYYTIIINTYTCAYTVNNNVESVDVADEIVRLKHDVIPQRERRVVVVYVHDADLHVYRNALQVKYQDLLNLVIGYRRSWKYTHARTLYIEINLKGAFTPKISPGNFLFLTIFFIKYDFVIVIKIRKNHVYWNALQAKYTHARTRYISKRVVCIIIIGYRNRNSNKKKIKK